jgi:hypothetical protein
MDAVVVEQFDANSQVSAAVYYLAPSGSGYPGHALAQADACGRWWYIHPDYLTLEAAGAPADVTADCSSALQSVFQYFGATSITQSCLKLGERDYVIGTQAILSTSQKDITIEGRGMGVSRFLVPGTNTSGAMSITFSDVNSQFTGKDFKIMAEGPGCGTALLVNCSHGEPHQVMATLFNVQVRGGDSRVSNYFLTGIDLTGCPRPNLQNVNISGVFGGIAQDNTDTSPAYLMQTGLVLDNCYSPHLESVFIYSASLGISHIIGSGLAIQGMGIVNSAINNVKVGILNQGCPDIIMSGIYINYRDVAIKFYGVKPGSLNIKAHDIL